MDKKFVTIIIIITKMDRKNSFKHIYPEWYISCKSRLMFKFKQTF